MNIVHLFGRTKWPGIGALLDNIYIKLPVAKKKKKLEVKRRAQVLTLSRWIKIPPPSIGRLYIDPLLKDKRKVKGKFAGQQGPPTCAHVGFKKMKKTILIIEESPLSSTHLVCI